MVTRRRNGGDCGGVDFDGKFGVGKGISACDRGFVRSGRRGEKFRFLRKGQDREVRR